MNGTVIIIEDDEAVRESLKLLLESHGLRVKDFASCEAFTRDGQPLGPSCLIVDQNMPGMTGIDLIEELCRTGEIFPAILVTGRGDNALRARAQAAGVLAYLEKPVVETRLLPLIRQALAAS